MYAKDTFNGQNQRTYYRVLVLHQKLLFKQNIILYYLIFTRIPSIMFHHSIFQTKLVLVDFSVCSSLTSLIFFLRNCLIASSSFPYYCNPNNNKHADANCLWQNRGTLQYMSKSGYRWIMQHSMFYVFKLFILISVMAVLVLSCHFQQE